MSYVACNSRWPFGLRVMLLLSALAFAPAALPAGAQEADTPAGQPEAPAPPEEPGAEAGAGAGAEAGASDLLRGEVIAYDEVHPIAGRWLGTVTANGTAVMMEVILTRQEPAEPGGAVTWTATLTLPNFGLFGSTAKVEPSAGAGADTDADGNVDDADPSALRISADIGRGMSVHLTLAPVGENAQRANGTVHVRQGERTVQGPLSATVRRLPLYAQLRNREFWAGDLTMLNRMTLDISIHLGQTPGGTWLGAISIPAQNVADLAFTEVTIEGDRYTMTMPSPMAPGTFVGTRSADGATITGTFRQMGQELALRLERVEADAIELRRPQTPKPPFSYVVDEVRIEHPDGHVLAGTLTRPADDGAGPFAAAVLLTGSGPQDRDETLLGHKPFAVIADHLTRQGLAVLRCDDRGIGSSTGTFETATTEDFATDALACVAFLRGRQDIDAGRIGLIGHSEGGLVATLAAVRNPEVAFCVFLAGPGVPGEDILNAQARLIAEAEGVEPADVDLIERTHRRLFPLFRGELEGEELEQAVRTELVAIYEGLTEEQREQAGDLDDAVQQYLMTLDTPWFRYFLRYDPRPDLQRIRCPVLALNGMLDLQVPWDQNLPEIWKALVRGGNHDVQIVALPGLNHLFQEADTGAVSEYARIEQTFAPVALERMTGWLHAKLGLDGE